MNDELNIFDLYLEVAATEEQPVMHTYPDGTKRWMMLSNGDFHRTDGPAVEQANGIKAWFIHGNFHREDGPAIQRPNGENEWYLNDVRYNTPEAWAEALLKHRNQPHDAMSINDFLKQILKKYAAEAL